MVDNVQADPGAAGAIFATDEVAGIHYPWNKLAFGPNDTITKVTATVGLPVKLLAPATGALEIAKIEDTVHSSGDVGIMVLGVRNDAGSPQAADGDYIPFQMNDEGSLQIHEEDNHVDPNNSSTTPLGSGATFTGTGVDVLSYSAITIFVDSDVDSAADGVSIELSTDNINWDYIQAFDYAAASGAALFQLSGSAKYFRFVYTNGAGAQTTFRLQTILHHVTPVAGTHRLVDDEDPDQNTTLTKAAIIGQRGGAGDFIPIQSTMMGSLKVSIEESNGNITGGGTEATALRVTIANNSTGLLNVIASAGTDLNTSALALEAGGVLDAIAAAQLPDGHNVTVDNASLTVDNAGTFLIQEDGAALTSLQLLDNAVSGAGYNITQLNGVNVSMGNGVSGTGVQRVTLASNGTGQVKLAAGTALAGKFGIDQVTANANEVVTKTGSVTKLEANDGTDIGDVGVTSQPARVATVDNVGAAIQTNQLMDGVTSLTPKFAAIDVGASGDNTLVALVSGKKIRVLQVTLIATAAVNVRFESGAAGTPLTGQMALTANSGFEASFCPVGLFETASGVLLNLELSSAVTVDGWLVYVEV